MSTGVRSDIVRELRQMFLRGYSVCELITFLQEKLDLKGDQRLFVFIYLAESFKLPLPTVQKIGGWRGFSDGTQTDEEIEEILNPDIRALEREWINDAAIED